MISANFYPTTYTYADGALELTNDIKNLMSTENLGSPYYMGYILHDDFPECLKVKKVNFANGLSYEPIESNHSWGLWYNRATYNAQARTSSYSIFQSGSDYLPTSTSLNYCFVNKIKMANVNYINAVTINIVGMYIPVDDLDDTGNTGFKARVGSLYFEASKTITSDINISNTISIGRLKSVVDGDAPIIESWTYSISNGQETVSRTFPDVYITDFNENRLLKVVCTDGDYMFIGSIINFDPIDRGALSYLNASQAQSIVSGVPTPFFESDVDDVHIIYNRGYRQYSDARLQYYYQLKILRAPVNVYTEFKQENYCFDRFPEFKLSTFDIPSPSNMYNKSAVVDDDYFLTPTGSGSGFYQFRIYPKHDLADIYKFLMYYHKIQLTAYGLNQLAYNPTYTTNISVSLFNDTDQSENERVSDDYANIEDQLRDWQQPDTNIAVNEYDPTDKPEYDPTPPGPSPQETEPRYPGFPTLGSSTRYVPTAGVNFYALNNSLVSTFIQRLWSQPKNFYEAIQIAGNQVDSIFDYIQSFRYYPLNYNFSAGNAYPVIFGTGAVLKEADGDTNFQLSEAYPIQDTVTAGEWNLSDSIYHWRKNFLDYSPYLKMSIYLPFAGTIELSPEAVASHSDISAATITLLASFDIETGTITYYVINQANVLLAQKTAKVAIDLPLSGNNSAEQSAAILKAQFSTVKQLLGAGTSAVTGAATAGMAGVASATVSTLSSVGDMYLQNSLAQRAVPVEVQGMGGTFSALAGGQYPYITINRQKVSNPPNYAHTTGYLVEGTYKISSLNGLTVCRNVDVSGIGQATDKEKAQIKQILESGFYA